MQSTSARFRQLRFATVVCIAAYSLTGVSLANAHTFCADSSSAIQAALIAASDGGANANEDNTIRIVIGTYSTADGGDAEFSYLNKTTARKLDVNGGYNSDCTIITENPALTMLDGAGVTRVFESESVSGDVSLRYLTFQNGNVGTNESGGGVLINQTNITFIYFGPVIFDQNIVRNNHSANDAGGFLIGLGGGGTLQFENNLIVGNSADGNEGAGEIIDDGSGANVINNTFVQNAGSQLGGLYFVFDSSASPPPDTMSNNIFWDNVGYDLATAAVLVDNDYNGDEPPLVIDPTSIGNVYVDPNFSSTTDFRLLPTSPLLGYGTVTPTGGLPSIDIEGYARSYNGHVDLGAYERGDEVFRDGFED